MKRKTCLLNDAVRSYEISQCYLNAFLCSLSAMHHGSEGKRGDESAQEVLNAHAEDGHT